MLFRSGIATFTTSMSEWATLLIDKYSEEFWIWRTIPLSVFEERRIDRYASIALFVCAGDDWRCIAPHRRPLDTESYPLRTAESRVMQHLSAITTEIDV